MQFALPPRKNAPTPLPYARSPGFSHQQRRNQLKAVALLAFGVLSIVFLLSHVFAFDTTTTAIPAGTSSVVIVTLLDRAAWSESYVQKIVHNREDYAKRHGKRDWLVCFLILMRMTARLCQLFRKRVRLRGRAGRRPVLMGHSPCRSPRDGVSPSLDLLLPSEPSRLDHEPEEVAQIPPPRQIHS